NRASTAPKTVSIRRQGVASTVEVAPVIFSPNGDGYKDEVTYTIHSVEPEIVERWSLRILNRAGRTVHEFNGSKEPPRRVVWDGKTDPKTVAPDGAYNVVLFETDKAGNTSSSTPQPCEIDNTPPRVQARFEPNLLSPGKHGFHDSGIFNVKAEDSSPLQSWSLKIVNDVGRPVKAISGAPGSKPVDKLEWRGEG